MSDEGPAITDGFLLDGRVRYAQPRHGYRTGIEPVLLAAAVPAREGERVLEAGTGAGAGLLCLGARLPAVTLVGVEIDPAMAALAGRNLHANGLSARARVITGDIAAAPSPELFDHACANPPWHASDGTASPIDGRERAKSRSPDLLSTWASALATRLRPRGTLTLILPASLLSAATESMTAAGCGAFSLVPLWPKVGVPARLMLIQAIRTAKGPDRIMPGLTLHDTAGAYTAAANAILRDGAALDLFSRAC